MIVLNLNRTKYNSISAFLELIEHRSREPTIKKELEINAHSISKHLNTDYKSVKIALKNLYKKTKEIQI